MRDLVYFVFSALDHARVIGPFGTRALFEKGQFGPLRTCACSKRANLAPLEHEHCSKRANDTRVVKRGKHKIHKIAHSILVNFHQTRLRPIVRAQTACTEVMKN